MKVRKVLPIVRIKEMSHTSGLLFADLCDLCGFKKLLTAKNAKNAKGAEKKHIAAKAQALVTGEPANWSPVFRYKNGTAKKTSSWS